IAIVTGDYLVFGVGVLSTALLVLCLGALWMSARYEKQRVWMPGEPSPKAVEQSEDAAEKDAGESLKLLILKLLGAAVIIFAAGFLLSLTGDALAEQSGLGKSFVGFLLVGMSTSLPELSTITGAIRLKRHEMAVGDILGSNIFNLLLIFLTDVV